MSSMPVIASLALALIMLAGCGADGAPFIREAGAGGAASEAGARGAPPQASAKGIELDCSVGTTNGSVSIRVGC